MVTPTIVFDLDGTLIETVLDLVPALNHTIASQGLEPVTVDQIRPIVSAGSKAMIRQAYKLQDLEITDELCDQLFDQFISRYEANISNHSVFYDGCLSAMETLASNGFILAVCTNKYEVMAKKLLSGMGSIEKFASISGGDTFEFRKPDPRHILETIAAAGGNPKHAIMIGDSYNDIEAAKRANVMSIAVDFGYSDVPVSTLGANAIISHFDDLYPSVQALMDS